MSYFREEWGKRGHAQKDKWNGPMLWVMATGHCSLSPAEENKHISTSALGKHDTSLEYARR